METTMPTGVHYIGIQIDGVWGRFVQQLSDAEFEPIAKRGLPKGFRAYHFGTGETVKTSERIRVFAKRPLVRVNGALEYNAGLFLEDSGKGEYATPSANCLKALEAAWGNTAREMRLYACGEDIGYRWGKCCLEQDDTMEAHWRVAPASHDACERCGKPFTEWEIESLLLPPKEERAATDAELRDLGWRVDGDVACDTCGLYEWDGKFPVCGECGNCTECGCEDTCQGEASNLPGVIP